MAGEDAFDHKYLNFSRFNIRTRSVINYPSPEKTFQKIKNYSRDKVLRWLSVMLLLKHLSRSECFKRWWRTLAAAKTRLLNATSMSYPIMGQ